MTHVYMTAVLDSVGHDESNTIYITNLHTRDANVSYETIYGEIGQETIRPGQTRIVAMKERDRPELKGCVAWDVYRIATNQTIAVYKTGAYNTLAGFVPVHTYPPGTTHRVVTPQSDHSRALFVVIGVYPDTRVVIKVRIAQSVMHGGNEYKDGDSMHVMLGEFDTIQIESNEGDDLTGTAVMSTKPVSVFIGYSTAIGINWYITRYMTNQLPPVNVWGRDFIGDTTGSRDFYLKFVPHHLHTVVTYNCVGGDSDVDIPLTTTPYPNWYFPDSQCQFWSNMSLLIAMANYTGISILSPLLEVNTSLSFVSYNGTSTVMLLTHMNNTRNLTVDCGAFTDIVAIPNADDTVIAYKELESGVHVIRSVDPFVLQGYMYGITTDGRQNVSTLAYHVISSDSSPPDCPTDALDSSVTTPTNAATTSQMSPATTQHSAALTTQSSNAITPNSAVTSLLPSGTTQSSSVTPQNLASASLIPSYTFQSTSVMTPSPLASTQVPLVSAMPSTPGSLVTAPTAICQCRMSRCPVMTNYSTAEMDLMMVELWELLHVDPKSTTKYRQLFVSMPDDRPSAQAVGYMGCVLLLVMFVGTLILDSGNIVKMVKTIKRNCSSK